MLSALLSFPSLILAACAVPSPVAVASTGASGGEAPWEAAVVADAAEPAAAPADYVLHEWGTFTTVSDAAGAPVVWAPLEVLSDLPGFVYTSKMVRKVGRATVRMETPVIYLYSEARRTVSVEVRFPDGAMTEWYPAASDGDDMDRLRWPEVRIGAEGPIPDDGRRSHYYPARQAGADRLQVGEEREDFLFYRGIGNFDPALRFRVEGDQIRGERIGAPVERSALILYRQGDRAGVSLWRAGQDRAPVPALERGAGEATAALKAELRAMLTGAGLYAAESEAMLATWEGDWFEPGLRVLWLYTGAEVDAVLPLTADPPPRERVRVLVGRTELFTEAMQAGVAGLLAEVAAGRRAQGAAEAEILARYGRFAEPIRQVAAARLPAADRARLERLGLIYRRQGIGHLQ